MPQKYFFTSFRFITKFSQSIKNIIFNFQLVALKPLPMSILAWLVLLTLLSEEFFVEQQLVRRFFSAWGLCGKFVIYFFNNTKICVKLKFLMMKN